MGRDGIDAALCWADEEAGRGPLLLHLAVDEREAVDLERPKLSPEEIAAAFRDGVSGRLQ